VSAKKHLTKFGVLLAQETTSYASGTPALAAATDGFLVYQQPDVDIAYLNDGQREGVAAGNGSAELASVPASGRKFSTELAHYFKGAGAAYTTSVRSSIDRVLQALGMSATLTSTPGSEKIDYALISDHTAYKSLVGEVYTRGQKYSLKGGYVSKLVIEAKGLVCPKLTFSLAGIGTGLPTDATVPAITYGLAAVKNPKATNIGLSLASGGQTFAAGKVREFTLTLEREIVERANQNSATDDHAGFALGEYTVTLEALFEATALVTGSPFLSSTDVDPYRLYENASSIAVLLGIGSTQYNRLKVSAPTAQFVTPPKSEADGPVALWGVSLKCRPSDEVTDNGLLLTTD
jgi:hypothetical protein